MLRCLLLAVLASVAYAAELPRGQIIDDVKCGADPTESYALYLPSNYLPDRTWPVILAFDPRARGRAPVVQYQAAAEKYGYIVAGSNNSKNGPWAVSLAAAKAMSADISRFSVDPKRMYTAGLSGGARVAMALAISSTLFAGVIPSSAGFPDSRPRTSLAFAVFATAGTDDFNYLEIRRLDRVLTSPHRVAIFHGGHTWLPSDLAVEAIEWMEIQAMKSGLRDRDEAMLDELFKGRKAKAAAETNATDSYLALNALAADFDGLKDVSEFKLRADALGRDKEVQKSLKNERAEEQHEEQMNKELAQVAAEIDNPATRRDSLEDFRTRLTKLARQARASDDSAERRMARRVLWAIIVDNSARPDPELHKLLEEVRPADRP